MIENNHLLQPYLSVFTWCYFMKPASVEHMEFYRSVMWWTDEKDRHMNKEPVYLSVCLTRCSADWFIRLWVHLNQVLQCGRQPSEDQQQVKRILSEALFTVKAELDSLPHPTSQCEEPQVNQGVKGEGEKALALLEQYAELLLKSVERRLDTKTWGDKLTFAMHIHQQEPGTCRLGSTVNCTLVICTEIFWNFINWTFFLLRGTEENRCWVLCTEIRMTWKGCLIFQDAIVCLCLFSTFLNCNDGKMLWRETLEGQWWWSHMESRQLVTKFILWYWALLKCIHYSYVFGKGYEVLCLSNIPNPYQ